MAPDLKDLLGKLAGVDLNKVAPNANATPQAPVSEHSNGVVIQDDEGSDLQYPTQSPRRSRTFQAPRLNTTDVKVVEITELSASTPGYGSDSDSLSDTSGSAPFPATESRRDRTQIPKDLIADINFKPSAPEYGLILSDFETGGTHVARLQFIECTFNEEYTTVFTHCQLMNVTFFRCDFQGFSFQKVVLKGNKFSECTFPKGRHWVNRKLTECSSYQNQVFTSFDSKDEPKELYLNKEKDIKPIFAKPDPYKQREPSEGEKTGWGVPKGSKYDAGEVYYKAPEVLNPRSAADTLRPGMELDNTSSRGLKMIAGAGERYTLSVFRNCKFENTMISNCIFDGVIFENCTFKDAKIIDTVIRQTTYQDCHFIGCQWKNRSIRKLDAPYHLLQFIQNDIKATTPKLITDQALETAKKVKHDQYALSRVTNNQMTWPSGKKINMKRLDQTAETQRLQDSLKDGEVWHEVAAPPGLKAEEATVFSTPKWF